MGIDGVELWESFVARRIRSLREEFDLTQEQLAERLRNLWGLRWSRATVANVERGGRAVSAKELIALFDVLARPQDFFDGVGSIQVADDASLRLRAIRKAFDADRPSDNLLVDGHDTPNLAAVSRKMPDRGLAASVRSSLGDFLGREPTPSEVQAVVRGRVGDDEARAAQRLGVDAETVAHAAVALWQQRLPEERDRRLFEAPAAKSWNIRDPNTETRMTSIRTARGHYTRELLAELREYLAEEGDT